jgi:hypothetical protein
MRDPGNLRLVADMLKQAACQARLVRPPDPVAKAS